MLTLIPSLDLYMVEAKHIGDVRPVHPVHLTECDAYVTVGILKRKDRKLSDMPQEYLEYCRNFLLKESEQIDLFMEEKDQ